MRECQQGVRPLLATGVYLVVDIESHALVSFEKLILTLGLVALCGPQEAERFQHGNIGLVLDLLMEVIE